jgi:adenylosuccinate synthase
MKMSAVIGANFGDEGKGLITDYLSGPDTVVVRFNGGAQAGHTVVTPEGRRHVFHHIGSGYFRGAETWLSKYFVANPAFFKREVDELGHVQSFQPSVFCDTDALVTTPWDMLVNQKAELYRNEDRHGSCGAGVWETIVRGKTEHRLTVGDLIKSNVNIDKQILYSFERLEYLTDKLGQLQDLIDLFWDDSLRRQFWESCEFFLDNVRCGGSFNSNFPSPGHIIFEGAQGLLLDADHYFFPYVSATNTGLCNVIKLCKESSLSGILETHYVTRSYMTRHGPGPFPTEGKFSFPDHTNSENKWQGQLRFGKLDTNLMYETVKGDYNRGYKQMATTCDKKLAILPYVAITHMDWSASPSLPYQLSNILDMPISFKSYGPNRHDVCHVYKFAHEMTTLERGLPYDQSGATPGSI